MAKKRSVSRYARFAQKTTTKEDNNENSNENDENNENSNENSNETTKNSADNWRLDLKASTIDRLKPSENRAEFVQLSTAKAGKLEQTNHEISRLQRFGRKYWPLLALLEFLALIGASLNGVLSRKRREEIERLNKQMREIMQRLEDEKFEELSSKRTRPSETLSLIGEAKKAYSKGKYANAKQLFIDAISSVNNDDNSNEDALEENLSARKGLAMTLSAAGDLVAAAAALEDALEIHADSTVFGMLGDVYTDMGELAKAGEMYDKCLEAMD